MGNPPSDRGGIQLTRTEVPESALAESRVGADGGTAIKIVPDSPGSLDPMALRATTENVYEVPFVNRLTVQLNVVDVVHVRPPGSAVTMYSRIGDSPLNSGSSQETTARPSPPTAETFPGFDGFERPTNNTSVMRGELDPEFENAVTDTLYVVLGTRPVNGHVVDVVLQVNGVEACEGLDVTTWDTSTSYHKVAAPPVSDGASQSICNPPGMGDVASWRGCPGANPSLIVAKSETSDNDEAPLLLVADTLATYLAGPPTPANTAAGAEVLTSATRLLLDASKRYAIY